MTYESAWTHHLLRTVNLLGGTKKERRDLQTWTNRKKSVQFLLLKLFEGLYTVLIWYILQHPDFVNSSPWPNDIAVLALSTSVDDSSETVGVIGISSHPVDHSYQECTISGWGYLNTGTVYVLKIDSNTIPDSRPWQQQKVRKRIVPMCWDQKQSKTARCQGVKPRHAICRNTVGKTNSSRVFKRGPKIIMPSNGHYWWMGRVSWALWFSAWNDNNRNRSNIGDYCKVAGGF